LTVDGIFDAETRFLEAGLLCLWRSRGRHLCIGGVMFIAYTIFGLSPDWKLILSLD
jgi:hypothetical protein